jgi:hypothetical protein
LHTFEKNEFIVNKNGQVAMLGFLLALIVLLEACAKKSISNRQSYGNEPSPTNPTSSISPAEKVPLPKGEPIDFPEAMATPRTHFQTRSDLKLFIDTYDLQSGQRIALSNKSTNQTIFARELPAGFFVPENPQSTKSFLEDRAFSLAAIRASDQYLGYRLIIRLVPGVLLSDKKIGHGSSQFSLFLEGTTSDRISEEKVVVRDFPYFSLGTSAFVNSQAQRGSTYQGRPSWVSGSLVRGAKSDLTVGTIGILNR